MNYDDNRIIGQVDPEFGIEGGDSVNYMAHWLYLNPSWEHWSAKRYIDTFEIAPGLWVRHPNPARSHHGWAAYADVNGWDGVISRDQMTGILCYLAKTGQRDAIRRLLSRHLRRGMIFASNTIKNGSDPHTAIKKLPDVTGPSIWALYIRGLVADGHLSYLMLCLCDFHLLIDSVANRIKSHNDVISHVIKLTLAHDLRPTVISRLANKINSLDNLSKKLTDYWCGWRDNCEFSYVWITKLGSFLK